MLLKKWHARVSRSVCTEQFDGLRAAYENGGSQIFETDLGRSKRGVRAGWIEAHQTKGDVERMTWRCDEVDTGSAVGRLRAALEKGFRLQRHY